MSNLVPEVRVNKNGVPVVKHVLPSSEAKSKPSFPIPSVNNRLPALKGKALKEAKEYARLAANGDQTYEDTMTAAFLDNDLRFMRIYHGLTNGGSYSHPDSELARDMIEVRRNLGLGADEDEATFIAKCEKYAEMVHDRGPVIQEDFDMKDRGKASDDIILWIEANWDDLDEIIDFLHERQMDDYSAENFNALWTTYKEAGVKALRDGII